MEAKNPYYRLYLQAELSRRCQKNSRYSLRAFAAQLEMDAGALSRVVSGKRTLTLPLARRMSESLELDPEERLRFVRSVIQHRSELGAREVELESMEDPNAKVSEISLDHFQVISDLYHYAILELTFVDEFQSNPRWIAKTLGITVMEAQLAMQRLLRLGLLVEVNGKLRKAKKNITTGDKQKTNSALKKHHRQVLQGALESMEKDPIEVRDMSSMTMAIDPKKLTLAKKLIADFTNELCRVLETGKKRKVYELGINLYPLQKEEYPK